MAPPSKASGDGRRKSGSKPSLVVALKVAPEKLSRLLSPEVIKAESPAKDVKDSPSETASAAAVNVTNGDNASDSNAATPAAEGTPNPSSMGPPTENPKKKGVKRSAPNNDGIPKPRGKPGPKKKPRLEDGTIDPNAKTNAAQKLGPKANQGAINAGLRALDRSGKPCRKWSRGGFTLKSFTGVVWDMPRWTAPPRPMPEEGSTEEASTAVSADNSSGKENKENGVEPNSVANSNQGAEQEAAPSAPSINASSPAPMAVGAAA